MTKKRRGRPRKRAISKNVVKRRSRRTIANKNDNLFSSISPETKKGIFVFILLIVGFLSFLALFDLSGAMGEFMVKIMGWVFGWLYFLIPFIFIVLGFLLLNTRKYIIRVRHYIGLILFLLSSTGLMNLIIGFNEIFEKIKLGQGGGYFGLILYWPFFKLAGFWGTLVLLFGTLIVSILLTFELSIQDLNILNKLREIISLKRDKIDEDEYIDEDDVYEEETFDESIEEDINEIDEKIEKDLIETDNPVKDSQKKGHKKKVYKKIQIPIDLLDNDGSRPVSCDIEINKAKIKKTLAHFGINVEMGEVHVGPTVTQFTLKPQEGIKLSKIMALQSNLAMSLAAKNVRIEAPIPGKALVGVEVPNKTVSIVRLREIVVDKKFRETTPGSLKFASGKDVSGRNVFVDLAKLPHLLIAGTTGSGKSVAIDSLLISLLYRLSPNELKFILIDPKRVGLSPYNGIPHLLTPVISKVDKIVNALKWLVNEMDLRYDILVKVNKKDIDSYNASVRKIENKMYKIVLVIDELADLMISSSRAEVETSIVRLAQMSRAVGIHLVLATQRPSVQVVTGLIKANINSRIAFNVPSQIDSRTMIDMAGAEKLLGKGDMLFTTAEISKPKRLQGAFISEEEKERVIDFLKKQAEPDYMEEVTEAPSQGIPGFMGRSGKADSLLAQAREVIIQSEKASATLLQRRLSVGYARAAKILDQLEEAGVVGPANGTKAREILIREGEEILESPVIETDENALNEELEEAADEILENNSIIEESDENEDEIILEDENMASSSSENLNKEIEDVEEINDDEEELNESDEDIEFEIEDSSFAEASDDGDEEKGQ